MDHRILNLYPATISAKNRLILIDRHDPEQYVIDEYNFCRKEVQAYCAAMTINERRNAAEDLYEARVRFAKKMGYIMSQVPKDAA